MTEAGVGQTSDCPNPEIHSVNGGPMRYCPCGWIEDTPAPVDVLATTWAAGHRYMPRGDDGFGCERCGRGPIAPVHNRGGFTADGPSSHEVAAALNKAVSRG